MEHIEINFEEKKPPLTVLYDEVLTENIALKEKLKLADREFIRIFAELNQALSKAAGWEQTAKAYQKTAQRYESLKCKETCQECSEWLKFEGRREGLCTHPGRSAVRTSYSDSCKLWKGR